MIQIYIDNEEITQLLDANADLLNSQYDLKDVRLSPPYIKCSYIVKVMGIRIKVPVDIEVVSTGAAIRINFKVKVGPLTAMASNEASGKVLKILQDRGLRAWKHGGSVFINPGEEYVWDVKVGDRNLYIGITT